MFRLALLLLIGFICTGLVQAQSNSTSNSTVDCTSFNLCDQCTDNHGCVFCSKNNNTNGPYCVPGGWSGPTDSNTECAGWSWGQCKMTGTLAIIIAACVGAAIIILCCAATVWIWCCFRRRNRKYKSLKDASADINEIENQRSLLRGGTRTPMTDTHRDAMREKYGLK